MQFVVHNRARRLRRIFARRRTSSEAAEPSPKVARVQRSGSCGIWGLSRDVVTTDYWAKELTTYTWGTLYTLIGMTISRATIRVKSSFC